MLMGQDEVVWSANRSMLISGLHRHPIDSQGKKCVKQVVEGYSTGQSHEADVLVLLGFLSRMSNAEAAPRASHLLGVLLDGLRTRD